MNLKLIFRISAVIALINGLGSLFATSMFFEMANLTISPSLITLGQFIGVTMLFLALVQWRIPDIAGDAVCDWFWNVVFNSWIPYYDRCCIRSHSLW